jgi:hypothetical protein
MSLVLPIEISFLDWAHALYIDLPHLDIPIAQDEKNWQEWAARLCEINQLSPNIPISYQMPTWQEWAHYFLQNSSTFQ